MINLGAVIVPPLGLLAAIVLLWGIAFNQLYLWILIVGYLLTGIGITVGFHRLFTHRSFDAPAVIRMTFGVLGSMAVQGPLLRWVAQHRVHHQHSDDIGDPHSPHGYGSGPLAVLRGFWHAHAGWLMDAERRDLARYCGDLRKDRVASFVSRHFILWVFLGLALPPLIAGLATWSWSGALLGFLWGSLVRVLLVHHTTWSINSVCHLWGSRPFSTNDQSRNNAVFGVLAMGEGWHNNHHAFPTSARHGLRWWEFDGSYWIIRSLQFIGLAWNVKVPERAAVRTKRQQTDRTTM